MREVEGPSDYEQAAELYRTCRRQGETPRKLTDCLTAAVAIRHQAQVNSFYANMIIMAAIHYLC